MISRKDLHELVNREPEGLPVLSVFLDMSVNSDQKRTHGLYLREQRGHYTQHNGSKRAESLAALEAAFDRVEAWLDSEYVESNRGVALYLEVGGDWLAGFQFPVPLQNRVELGERPVVAPLAGLLVRAERYAIALVDSEHIRMLDVLLGRVLDEEELREEPHPARHDVRAGGYSAKDYQKHKAEEVRHFFKDFAQVLERFVARHGAAHLILLGTDENTRHFLDFLPEHLRARLVHRAPAPVDEAAPAVLERLDEFFQRHIEERRERTIELLRERVRNSHFAVSGFHTTLEQLQEGKVETLVIATGAERQGARCTQCNFLLARRDSTCPYCGGTTEGGVDVVEAMIRMAAAQDAGVEFSDPGQMQELQGVGALLRF